MPFRDEIYPQIHALLAGDYRILADDVCYDCFAPIDQLHGKDAVINQFYEVLRQSFANLYRRDAIFMGGKNIRDEGGEWVASVTHYVGNFVQDFCGIAANNHLVFLRSGEFYRIEHGMITQVKMIIDLPNLMAQCGRNPFPTNLGTEITFPPPATQDGILPQSGDGKNSIRIMESMFANLSAFNPETFASENQTGENGSWHEKMMWYGPTGIGSNYMWQGFVQDHRESFLTAFPDRKGGNHYCRIGDGHYSAASGWPSMTMTFQGDYLGMKADNRPLTLRVMDFYRCDKRRICENWVHLDLVDLVRQMQPTDNPLKEILG